MGAYVRFTAAAVDDLHTLFDKDPQIVRQVFKKCLLLERNPYAGEPLLGDLIGYHKLVVGNRTWRIVWRVVDQGGDLEVEIAEIWAVGARSDSEVYAEVSSRIENAADSPLTHALGDIVSRFAPRSRIQAAQEPVRDPVPRWLSDRLRYTAGLEKKQIEGLTGAQAADLWDRYMRTGTLDETDL